MYTYISVIGDKVFERYFPDGTFKYSLNAVKVSTECSNNKNVLNH